jgi:hypothetical protein
MARRPRTRLFVAASAALAIAAGLAGPVSAGGPVFRESDAYTDRFFDDFIFDLCGIETWTTLTERWTYTEFADGSAIFHDVRTFVPDDVRIPVERGAGTRLIAADGSSTVVGSALRLFDQDGGMTLIGAGLVTFDPEGNPIRVRGQYPDLSDEALAGYYCPG